MDQPENVDGGDISEAGRSRKRAQQTEVMDRNATGRITRSQTTSAKQAVYTHTPETPVSRPEKPKSLPADPLATTTIQ